MLKHIHRWQTVLFPLLIGLSFCLANPLPAATEKDEFLLWSPLSQTTHCLSQTAPYLGKARLLLLGEQHDNPVHHLGQLRILQYMHQTGIPVALGLEMFRKEEQVILDKWVQGNLSRQDFKMHFQHNWGDQWGLYQEIFNYCRRFSIPMQGLNIRRSIVHRVAEKGFDSLSQELKSKLPPVNCRVDDEYVQLMRESMHMHKQEKEFTYFCQAQVLWDRSMAVHALEYLKANPQKTLLILAGRIHAWKKGIYFQIRRMQPELVQISILPALPGENPKKDISIEDCDFLLYQP